MKRMGVRPTAKASGEYQNKSQDWGCIKREKGGLGNVQKTLYSLNEKKDRFLMAWQDLETC